jgi:hypothetical protein
MMENASMRILIRERITLGRSTLLSFSDLVTELRNVRKVRADSSYNSSRTATSLSKMTNESTARQEDAISPTVSHARRNLANKEAEMRQ